MKRLTTSILACGILASGLLSAAASPTLRFSVDNGATWVLVDDNGGLDGNPQPGAIVYNGSISGIALSFVSGQGNPFTGTPSVPNMDLSVTVVSSQPANLIVQFSDTNLTTFPTETYVDSVSLGGDGTINQSSFRDSGNVLFGTTHTYTGLPVGTSPSPTALLLASTGPVSSFNLFSSNAVAVTAVGNVPNSLTIEAIFSLPNGGSSSLDAHLYAQPQPPCNCRLSFDSPATLTVCDGDIIPDVTASEDCGAGAVSVAVTPVSLTTNGTCPQVITRSYTAVDNCGTVHPFTQTVTNNCKPDCTITPSVTTTLVGSTNTASVADAGPGATYSWNILNGTIVSGQNTPTITWKAGSDASNPVSIMITITNGTGCFSYCSASVKLTTPPPPPFGSGDAATMGFWQNKNGQYLILNASNSPALGNWLATTFPCLYGVNAPAGDNLTGKANSVVAALFVTKFSFTGQKKQECQVFSVALACYFTSTSLGGGTGPVKFGFNQTPGGTGAKLFNVGPYGTALGLVNNTSYPILQILQAANSVRCGNPSASLPFDLFNSINQGGDIK